MHDFVHLHVHTQYSILDGQAAVSKLVDKAIKDGQQGIAVTDHGNMFGIKEFWNYVKKVNGKRKDKTKELKTLYESMVSLLSKQADLPTYLTSLQVDVAQLKKEADADKAHATDAEDRYNSAAATLKQVQAMQSEFGFDAQTAKQKVEKLENTPDFKAIIGCEVYVAHNGLEKKEGKEDQSGWHLILLAKNQKGYKNLIKIVSKAWTEGFYMRPRTDHSELEKYHEGIICCSACLGGEIPKLILANQIEQAEKSVQWFKKVFGEDYYLELQLHKATVERANHDAYPMQVEVNKHLVEFSKKYDIPLICTNDVHFVDEDDAEAHDRLICLSTGKDLDDPKRMLYSKQEWMKTRAQMNEVFAEYPEALDNTISICNKVESYSIDHAPIMPTFQIPEEFGTEEQYRKKYSEKDLFDEFTQDEHGNVVLSEEEANKKIAKLGGYDRLYRIKLEADYLTKLAMDGAVVKYGDKLTPEVKERLIFELHVMKTMGFPGYFLIVQDFINAARNKLGVWVGPGRGSAAGSAVAYCLGITQIDPIEYDLLFERFLNPDRISLPDIDIDFDDEGRGRVLDWVTQKYGKEKVAHIITYGTMATKMAIKDVARVEKLPLTESDRLCKLVPDRIQDPKDKDKTLKINLTNAINAVPELQEAEKSENPLLSDTIKFARKLEGNVRGTGVHACGTIICRDDITDWVPVSTADDKETGQKMLVTQYEGSVIEDTGLIKMDFLGLKNLSIMKEATANIKQTRDQDVDVNKIPKNDPATYKLYSEGRTIGTFQFESAGMQKYLCELKPSVFEDLIAMNALYRPGPMDYIPDFIDRKLGRKPIEYDIPIMEKYLKDTYGITVYQEQVMLLSRLLSGFTRGESDTLRKAMGKKLKEKLDALKPKFIKGGVANGHKAETLQKIWADWEKFASYAFNKSHATCYSWVAYQTAYLKANFPSEYMAAVLSANLNDITTLTTYMSECKHMGIDVLSPDINESMLRFSSNKKGDIRFGLAAIKGVGEAASNSIIEERNKNGKYKDIYDFFERLNSSVVNRKCIESCAYAGVFDSIISFPRSNFFAPMTTDVNGPLFLDALIKYGQRYKEEQNNAQQSLFGFDTSVGGLTKPKVPFCEEWNKLMLLNKEKDVIGLYLSSHPLDEYKLLINQLCNASMKDLQSLNNFEGKDVCVIGVVTSVENRTTKTGKSFGIFKVEDYSGSAEFRLFGKSYETFRPLLYKDYFLVIRGKVAPRPYGDTKTLEYQIYSIEQLNEVRDKISNIELNIPTDIITEPFIKDIVSMVKASKGKALLKLTIIVPQEAVSVNMFAKKKRIAITPQLEEFIERYNIKYSIN